MPLPQETDIPKPSPYLPAGWEVGDAYKAPASIVGINNPQFIPALIPLPTGIRLRDIPVVGNKTLH